jgi:hypothetical protein
MVEDHTTQLPRVSQSHTSPRFPVVQDVGDRFIASRCPARPAEGVGTHAGVSSTTPQPFRVRSRGLRCRATPFTSATEMEAPHRRQSSDVSRDGLESHLPGRESHVLVVEDLSPASRVRQRGPEPLRSVQQRRQPVPASIQGVIGTLGGEGSPRVMASIRCRVIRFIVARRRARISSRSTAPFSTSSTNARRDEDRTRCDHPGLRAA